MDDTARILVIDEDEAFCRVVGKALEKTGNYSVHVARDDKEGLDMAKRLSPHAILLDVAVPKTRGIEILRELKRLSCADFAPLIIATWHPDSGPIDSAVYNYAQQFLVKPVSSSRLSAILERLLAASRPAHSINKPVEEQKGSENAPRPQDQ